jgi:predicted PurR-regulated permease PerM
VGLVSDLLRQRTATVDPPATANRQWSIRLRRLGRSSLAERLWAQYLDGVNRRLLLLFSDKRVQRTVLLLLLWVPALVVLLVVREVLLPFLLAFALAYVITPPVRWLSSRSIRGWSPPRWVSVITLYLGTAVIVFATGRIFVPQLYKELSRLGGEANVAFQQLSDDNIARQADVLEAWVRRNDLPIRIVTAEDEAPLDAVGPVRHRDEFALRIDVVTVVQNLIRDVKHMAREKAGQALSQLQSVVAQALGFVFSTFVVLMLTAFIVADAERLTTFVFTITPIRDRSSLEDLIRRIDHGLSGVVRGQLTICIINGLLTLVGLLLLKVKFAFLLATMAAVFSLVPIFGSILSTIPIVIVGLSSGVTTALLAVLWIVGIHALEANLLNPKIMGDAAKIHPVLIVLALVTGEHFYGLVGALLAVPIMSIFVTIWKAVRARAMTIDEEISHVDAAPVTNLAAPRRRTRLRDGG